ncbi:hypothetical protein E1B28_000611 [Marasmius oreades]|uniref:Uncharacterized protein n=1 Tax=Marasmius oreades TaxID=181124 RepID=A0A9P8AEN5_9AGAR|nr:uncharacterized protein E1B28_000611 [Marasmius oreades]KAG7098698.1 hypothetical protein E1B28_000611 [Marasmius oreades]
MVPFHPQSPLPIPHSRQESQSFEFSSSARLPESNARSEPWSVQDCVDAARKRRRLCSSPSQALPNHNGMIPHQTQEKSRIHISKGVVQEGNHIILTHQHPAISQCLAHIRKTLTLPSCTPETVLALCSIEVFLHPSDPAHWLFWSNERKANTVEVLNRICDASPAVIQPSRTWSDSMLYSLPQLHCQAWHDILHDEPWYPTLVGGRSAETSTKGPTLRKRKAVTEMPSSTNTMSPLPETADDIPASAAKRMRTTRSQQRPATEVSPEAKPATCISATPPGSVPPLSVPPSAPSSRRNSARPIRRPAKFRDPEWSDSSRSSSCSPSAVVALLPPAANSAVQEPETDARRGSSSSARTLIGSDGDSRGSSPMSDLTTITLVDAEIVSVKTRTRKVKRSGVVFSASASREKTRGKGTPSVRMMTRARARIRTSN